MKEKKVQIGWSVSCSVSPTALYQRQNKRSIGAAQVRDKLTDRYLAVKKKD